MMPIFIFPSVGASNASLIIWGSARVFQPRFFCPFPFFPAACHVLCVCGLNNFLGRAVKLRDKKTLPSSGSVLDFNFRTCA
jgi:hypothetical protein